jgi:hypothetical protein
MKRRQYEMTDSGYYAQLGSDTRFVKLQKLYIDTGRLHIKEFNRSMSTIARSQAMVQLFIKVVKWEGERKSPIRANKRKPLKAQ